MAKRKTKKSIYHHLHLNKKGGMIYYDRRFGDRREHFSTQTKDWEKAAEVRDEFERKLKERVEAQSDVPTFAVFAERTRQEDMGHYAASSLEDRKSQLKPDGRILRTLGSLRLDQFTLKVLREWWTCEIINAGLSPKTGRNYLDAISAVLNYAKELEIINTSPVDDLRATFRRKNRTQMGRAAAQPKAHPIESPADVYAFVKASEALGGDGHLADMLMLDAGLRLAEVSGLRWCDVRLGKDLDDLSRSLTISETVARGRHPGKTKSGLRRDVAMSMRLRTLLRDRWIKEGQPDGEQRIIKLDTSNYRKRHFASVCRKAKIGKWTPKDLRDTYASQLLTAGVPLGLISVQLRHADVGVTAKHYARWVGGTYRRPLEVLEGEHPADFLARLATELPDRADKAYV